MSASEVQEDNAKQVNQLKGRILHLESQLTKAQRIEESKKKLELEVAYWKEYVTKFQSTEHPQNTLESEQTTSTTVINLQSELEEVKQKLSLSQAKLTSQAKEFAELKLWSQEASTMLAVHKATADTLRKELDSSQKRGGKETVGRVDSTADDKGNSGGGKFNAVRSKLQQIERELHQKSKELEKANESRSKVAKYTRSLLQELEAKLNDTQRRAVEWEDKALIEQKNVKLEQNLRTSLEKELESLKQKLVLQSTGKQSGEYDKRLPSYSAEQKDLEKLLQEKDAQLRFSEDVIKQLQISLKKVANQQQSSDQLQLKLSEATHKVSESHIKIHMLTKQVEELKPFERKYLSKVEECHNFKSQVSELNKEIYDLKNRIDELEKDLEMQSIKEVVLKEQLMSYEYDSSEESGDESELEKHKSLKDEIDQRINKQAADKKEELRGKGDTHLLIAKLECAAKEATLKSRQLLDLENELCVTSAALLSAKHDLADANDVLTVQNESLAEKSEECAAKSHEIRLLKERLSSSKSSPVDSVDGVIINKIQLTRQDMTRPQTDSPVHDKDEASKADILASLIKSEKQVIELYDALERESKLRIQLEVSLVQMERKIADVSVQLEQANKSLNLKVEELDKERHNVIHLVDVTGVYVKELEEALQQSRNRLQSISSSNGAHPEIHHPKTISHAVQVTSSSPVSVEDKEKYLSRIAMLESQVSTLSSMYDSRPEDRNGKGSFLSNEDIHESSQSQAQSSSSCEFCSDRADLLDRVQEIELELQESRDMFDSQLQEQETAFKEERLAMEQEIMHLMTKQPNAAATSDGNVENQVMLRLTAKINSLELELKEIHMKHDEDLAIEKESHQKEMEETIRDMLLIKSSLDSSSLGVADDAADGRISSRRSSISLDDVSEIREEYERKITVMKENHALQIKQCSADMETVLESLGYGNPGNVIVGLTTENRALTNELEQIKNDFELEKNQLKLALEKSEYANFTGLTRNEEMATKIFEMQNELEELERREKQPSISSEEIARLTGRIVDLETQLQKVKAENLSLKSGKNDDRSNLELQLQKIKSENASLKSRLNDDRCDLESQLERLKTENVSLQTIKTDNNSDLESQLQRVKAENEALQANKSTDRSTLAVTQLTTELTRLKLSLKQNEEKYKTEITTLNGLLREAKRREADHASICNTSKTKKLFVHPSLDDECFSDRHVETVLNSDALTNHKQWIEKLLDKRQKHSDDHIAQVRSEYEEKLKECMKENMRRISQSQRKTESQRVKEANRRISDLETELLTSALDHEKELAKYRSEIDMLRSQTEQNNSDTMKDVPISKSDTNNVLDPVSVTSPLIDSESSVYTDAVDNCTTDAQQSDNEIQRLKEQISRYEKRVDYYKEKAQRENSAESQRVNELQDEISELQSAMKELKSESQKQYRRKKPEATDRVKLRHSSDGIQFERQSRPANKRWSSDVQGKQEAIVDKMSSFSDKRNKRMVVDLQKEDVGKSVAARKAIWENIDRN